MRSRYEQRPCRHITPRWNMRWNLRLGAVRRCERRPRPGGARGGGSPAGCPRGGAAWWPAAAPLGGEDLPVGEQLAAPHAPRPAALERALQAGDHRRAGAADALGPSDVLELAAEEQAGELPAAVVAAGVGPPVVTGGVPGPGGGDPRDLGVPRPGGRPPPARAATPCGGGGGAPPALELPQCRAGGRGH